MDAELVRERAEAEAKTRHSRRSTAVSAIGPFTALVGLIVVFPVLGHATWHAYRAVRGNHQDEQSERMFIQPA